VTLSGGIPAAKIIGEAQAAPDAAGEPSIAIDNFTFASAEVTVKAGTKVLFVNHDDIPHLVVLENGKVRSGVGYG
jgi:plastocyanin